MFEPSWFTTSGTAVLMTALSALGAYVALIVFTRLLGVRSFSKMSSFDFAVTVAFGSILGAVVIASDPPLLQGVSALAALYVIQGVVGALRPRWSFMRRLVDNEPILVLAHGEVLEDNLKKAKMTIGDLRAKLRGANILRWSDVRAVVVETTGDVSVLHATDDREVDLGLFEGVRASDQLVAKQRRSD